MSNGKPEITKKEILKEILEEASYRPVVPFFGAGVSISAGFPTIRFVIEYLAKVDFAIQYGVFEDRFPNIKEKDRHSVLETYRRHPSKYLEDFGWPNLGQLNTDIWEWLGRLEDGNKKNGVGRKKILEKSYKTLEIAKNDYDKRNEELNNSLHNKKAFPDLLLYDVYDVYKKDGDDDDDKKSVENFIGISTKILKTPDKSKKTEALTKKPLDLRDYQRAIVQWALRNELAGREYGTNPALLKGWLQWKYHYHSDNKGNYSAPTNVKGRP